VPRAPFGIGAARLTDAVGTPAGALKDPGRVPMLPSSSEASMTFGITQVLVVTGGAILLFGSRMAPRLARQLLSARHELMHARTPPLDD
jgi:hypothetical protein